MQQKLALILTRARQSSNQFRGMTSLVGHECGSGWRHVRRCISTKQCVLQPAMFLEAPLGEHQPQGNKQHYVFLIILNKYVDTNMTRSHPDDLWRTIWQLNCLSFSLFVLHTFGGSTGPANYRWQDRKTCHSDVHDKWRRDSAAKHRPMNLKNAHTCVQSERQKQNKRRAKGGIRLFWQANFATRIYSSLQMKGRI